MPSGSTTVTEARSHPSSGDAPDLALSWVFPRAEGALRPGLGQELILGRDDSASVRLVGDGVSRQHAALRRDPATRALVIADLESRNGVFVNGHRVSALSLAAGDVVRIGGWVGVLTASPGPCAELAPGLLGGERLADALSPLRKAAESDLPVVLQGETGTGKEIVTRSLHGWSGRQGPLVAVNCASLPESLAEAELFGYRRGAFTGADRASPGFFRSAEGGTLLLDEVSDLPLAVQAKLLRVLEQREVQPLGEARAVPINVRVVVAGQRSLREDVRDGRFRADLVARLEGVTVLLPPLRERREDVLPLFSHALGLLSEGHAPAVAADFAERLCLYDWPFNVRELVLLARRLLVLRGDSSTLRAEHLPEPMLAGSGKPVGSSPTAAPKSSKGAEPVELPALLSALRASGGNVAQASAMLGITRQRAYRLMEGASVDLDALRGEEGRK
jgi:DNA-binding NtrC family response regulator